MVGSFAELPADASCAARECVVAAEDDGRLMVAVLEEAIYRMDAADELPVDVTVTPEPGGIRVQFTVTDSSTATQTGPYPRPSLCTACDWPRTRTGGHAE
ncbi:hypothetical protein M878_00170 [Streptomyces roseochromogenus subsp. oscitans DS 12.976]|uniref:Uncharacterized protein n=2 Tax=Streptomyces roseochromogenus TaxID=285450 RepID=V6KXQ4_STRRC|nr:hypothetical protein M878_00170 [Streptomyces roseochromogenus subsp. oscitans DS 12.976]